MRMSEDEDEDGGQWVLEGPGGEPDKEDAGGDQEGYEHDIIFSWIMYKHEINDFLVFDELSFIVYLVFLPTGHVFFRTLYTVYWN